MRYRKAPIKPRQSQDHGLTNLQRDLERACRAIPLINRFTITMGTRPLAVVRMWITNDHGQETMTVVTFRTPNSLPQSYDPPHWMRGTTRRVPPGPEHRYMRLVPYLRFRAQLEYQEKKLYSPWSGHIVY